MEKTTKVIVGFSNTKSGFIIKDYEAEKRRSEEGKWKR